MPVASPLPADPGVEVHFFWDQHKTEIVLALLVVLLAISGYTAYRFIKDRRFAEASAELADARNPSDFQKIIAKYPGDAAAANAYLLLAETQRTEKKYSDSITTLRTFTDKFPKHELITAAWMAIAADLEAAGKPDEALATYQQIAARYPQSFNAPEAMMSQVHILKEKNRVEDARKVCETIMTQYRDSLVVGEAQRELKLLRKDSDAAGQSALPKVPGISQVTLPGSPAAPSPVQSAAPPR